MRMKVLQINKYPSVKGGTETVLFKTIKLLKDEGHKVVLFSTDEGNISYQPSYVVSYPKPEDSMLKKISKIGSFLYNRNAASVLEKLILAEKPDIAHIHLYLNSFSVSILPVLKKYNIPVVMTLHEYRQICPSYLLLDKEQNICEKCIGSDYSNCLTSRCSKGKLSKSLLLTLEMYYRRLFYKTENYVDRFICVSNFLYTKHDQFNLKISVKSQVIYNPVDVILLNERKVRGNYLLYFGRFAKEKGLRTLLKAMEQLPDIKLKLAGEGFIDISEIPENVELLGFKTKDELADLIKSAMYTVIPSEWFEPFGMACAESLASGTPVIAARIGALPELITDGQNGYLFPAKDEQQLITTIKKAIALPDEEYFKMSDEAVRSVRKMSGKEYVRQLLEVYNNVINKRVR